MEKLADTIRGFMVIMVIYSSLTYLEEHLLSAQITPFAFDQGLVFAIIAYGIITFLNFRLPNS